MTNTPLLRERCASQLAAATVRASQLSAFLGLDGFVDEIIHVVDKRESVDSFQRLPTIARFAERVAAASGKSTNFELVTSLTKLGGNGPIMANALASFGLRVTYLGCLGYPHIHPVFDGFARNAEVHSIAEPGHTDALEFEDGKLMLGKHGSLRDINWQNITSRFGREKFAAKLATSDLVGFVNWTMLPFMSEIWEAVLNELCPDLSGPKRKLFVDLADPEKRTRNDISRALEAVHRFDKYFDVILGLNEKEAYELGKVLGGAPKPDSPEGLAGLAAEIQRTLKISTVVVHPVKFALAVQDGKPAIVEGPLCPKPLITTGAGDHFNSGFCLGQLLGLDPTSSVLTGVTTSGYYVRTGKSPSVQDLVQMLRNWPTS
jgi:sugar/nucleoside kinase (ribokinase family)